MRSIRFSAEARSDLGSISAFTAESWGIERKKRYMDALQDRIAQIRRHPALGPVREDFGSAIRSVICGAHVIFYRVRPSTIEVLRILHRRMDAGRYLDTLLC